jgi:hypothetical protein
MSNSPVTRKTAVVKNGLAERWAGRALPGFGGRHRSAGAEGAGRLVSVLQTACPLRRAAEAHWSSCILPDGRKVVRSLHDRGLARAKLAQTRPAFIIQGCSAFRLPC